MTPAGSRFDMAYSSPTRGAVSLGWENPLSAAGEPQPLCGYKRFDNPFVHVDFGESLYEIAGYGFSLTLDFENDRRRSRALDPDKPK